ncbi:hypothetical protein [Botrimarina sp.]|uniref:hypothetical protein n=1 Tax=Botrimarina sp. TaxID=2795802 RepID=UPI0032EBEF14
MLIAETDPSGGGDHWRFALHAAEAPITVAASDAEPGADEDRLVLLALVRGLEALDQPSEVTVVTRNASVLRGLSRDLAVWRNNHWRWERFGRSAPVRDADLWRRVDQALRFHDVRCRTWRCDRPGLRGAPPRPHFRPARLEDDASPLASGRSDSPAMVVVRTPRSRRSVRIAEPAVA